ncbi:MAG TPA: PilZ-like domain-containing protein, partial [Geobacteraceae bacterium]|nr:PilZ-like domain-containing protein [Geobacteraceae bacterium]
MTATPSEYQTYFRPGDLVSVGLYLANKTFAEDAATVLALNGGKIRLELCGNGFPLHLAITPGTRVVITKLEGRSIFICNGILKTPGAGRKMLLEL